MQKKYHRDGLNKRISHLDTVIITTEIQNWDKMQKKLGKRDYYLQRSNKIAFNSLTMYGIKI